jgi:hypothetical protein
MLECLMVNKFYQSLRLLHLLGLVLFLGSIFSHIVIGQAPQALQDPAALIFARKAIGAATHVLTIPGLALSVVTGIGMFGFRRNALLGARWFKIHATIAALIVIITGAIMLPVVEKLLHLANLVVSGAISIESFQNAALREHIFGAFNILLAFAAAYFGVFRPGLERRKCDRLR